MSASMIARRVRSHEIVPLAAKDMRLALAEAEQEAVPMPLASLVRDRLVGLMAQGWAHLDWSALGLLAARDASLGAHPH